VGCLHRQLACPENESVLDYQETGPSFTEDETEALLRASRPGDLLHGPKEKLENRDRLAWPGILPVTWLCTCPGLTDGRLEMMDE